MKISSMCPWLALLAPVAMAVMAFSSAAHEDCGAQSSQIEMNACFGRDLQRADSRLNGAYAKRLDGMRDDPGGARLLRDAERAWMDFRDKNCAFLAHGEEGGSVYSTMLATCRITMTEARTKEIQAQN